MIGFRGSLRFLAACAVLFAFVLGLSGSTMAAESVTKGDGVHEHDGFFLRLTLGPSYAHTEDDVEPVLALTGGGGAGSISLGWSLTPNLAIHLDSIAMSIPGPDAELGGAAAGTLDVTLGHQGVGPGASWYFLGSNTYLSASLLLSLVTMEIDGEQFETDTGFGFAVSGGKEWWVSDNWGLGVVGQLYYSDVPGAGEVDVNLSTVGLSVLLSATWN